jgi:poly(A) polymerase
MPDFFMLNRLNSLLKVPQLLPLLEGFERAEEGAWVVGGAVRDALRGRSVSDIDLATTALPERAVEIVKTLGFKAIPTGIAHGTITACRESAVFEVTTLRRDVSTNGRHAEVIFGQSLLEDAARRDFTINALYVSASGELIDPLNGVADLDPVRIRFIGDPVQRIREDYLRILRFFRFSAFESGDLDTLGFQACVQEQHGLTRLSKERITHELTRFLVAPFAPMLLSPLIESGLWHTLSLPKTLPEIIHKVLEKEIIFHIKPSAGRRLMALCSNKEALAQADAALCLTRAMRQQFINVETCLETWHGSVSSSDLQRAVAVHPLSVVTDALCLTDADIPSKTQALFFEYQNGLAPPQFPVKSSDLQRQGFSGKALGEERNRLLQEWLATL